ncbi:MAG: translocation/assembly module TamB [Spirochaetaceae bacterium]|jgi:hypothetical protein|nr:translocation/assembly module TamB [Spirochaetaceae bacterium]
MIKLSKKALDIIIEILVFGLLAAFSVLLFYPLQQELFERITETRDAYIEQAEKILDKKIYYAGMGPSVFGTIDLRGLSVYNNGDELRGKENAILTIERLRIKYSLWDLLREIWHISGESDSDPQSHEGGGAQDIRYLSLLSSVSSVIIDKPSINIKSQDEFQKLFKKKVDEKESGTTTEKKPDPVLVFPMIHEVFRDFVYTLPENFNIRINKGSIRLNIADHKIAFNSFSLNSYIRGKSLVLRADWKAELSLSGLMNEPFYVSIPGKAEGLFDFEVIRGEFNILLPEISTELFVVKRTRLLTVWTEEFMSVQKIDDKLPYDISFIARFSNSFFYTTLIADNFSLSDTITLKGRMAPYNAWLAARFKGSGFLSIAKDQRINYRTDFTGSLPESAPLGTGTFTLDASGNEKSIHFKTLKLILSRGMVSYTGSFIFSSLSPNGILGFENFYFGENGENGTSSPVSGDFLCSSQAHRISIFADELKIGDTNLSAFDIEMIRNKENWLISLSALRFNNVESYEEVSVSRINAEADFNIKHNSLSLSGNLDSFALNDLINIGGIPFEFPQRNGFLQNFTGDIFVTMDISLFTDFKSMTYKIPHFVAAYHGASDIIVLASISGSDKLFELSECHISYDGEIDLKAKADYSNLNKITFDAESIINQVPYQIKGSFLDKRILNITGMYNLALNAVFNRNGTIGGSLLVDSMVLPTLSKSAFLSLNANFYYISNENWNLAVDYLDIHNLLYSTSSSLIQISGNINQDRIYFPRLFFDDGKDPLQGEGFFSFKESDPTENESDKPRLRLLLGNKDGTENFSVQGAKRDDVFDLAVQAVNFKIYRFFRYSSNMTVNGVMAFTIEHDGAFNALFDLESLKGRVAGNELFLSGKGALNHEKIELIHTRISYANFIAEFPSVSIDRSQNILQAKVKLSALAGNPDLYADLDMNVDFAKTESWFDFERAFKEFSGRLSFKNAYFLYPDSPNQFDFNFSRLGNMIKLSGGPEDMLDAQIDTNGSFYASFSAPSPLIGDVFGVINKNTVNINTSDLYIDLDKLWNFFPDDLLVQCTGGFVLADIRIAGNIADPNIFGIAKGYGVKMKIPQYLSEEIGPAPVTLHLEGNEMYFDPILAPAGQGEGYITGSFYIERWLPRDFEISIAARPNKPIPYAVDISGVSAAGLVSGNISFGMSNNNLFVQGELTGSDSIITMDMLSPEQRQAMIDEEALLDIFIQTDLTIHADRKVEFLWPNASYPILRASANAGDSLRITGDTLTQKFSLVGDVNLRGGELFYFQRSFYITDGRLVFNENEIKFDPRISAFAETRDQANEGPVRIFVVIENQAINSLQPIIQSDPPLSQVEILSILGNTITGTPSEDNNQILRPFLASTTDILAQFQIVRRFERNIRDFLHVDMFSARTQALQNALFQAAFSKPEQRDPTVWNYFDNTTLSVGKYITSNLFVQSWISALYDKNRVEYGGLSFEMYFGVELSSPLLNIRADINPMNPNTLWIADTSITLSRTWRLP